MKTFQVATLVGIFASQTVLASAAPATPTVRDEQQMTRLGTQLLQDANHADQALQKNDDGAANRDIDDALAIRMKLVQEAKADGGSMVVPLYADLDDTEYLSTVGKKTMSNGTTSTTATSANAAQPLTVKSNVGEVTYMALDLDSSTSRLNAAKMAIHNRNDQAAEDSLAAIGGNLVELSVSTDLPLLTAREDLALARTALANKNNQVAQADLRQASQALTTYAASGPHAADAKRLASEIDTASGNASPSSPVSTDTVDSWWGRVKDWFAHPSV